VNGSEDGEFDLEVLMGRIREEVTRRKAATERHHAAAAETVGRPESSSSLSGTPNGIEPFALPCLSESRGPIARKDEYRPADFLAFEDEDFIRNAYRGLLRREPDAPGFVAHLHALRNERWSKIEILGHIRYSPEGRLVAVPVHGLRVSYLLRSIHRIPLIGRLLGVTQYAFRLPDLVHDQERLAGAVYRHQLELLRQISAAEARTRLFHDGIVGRLAALERNFVAVEQALRSKADAEQTRSSIVGLRDQLVVFANEAAVMQQEVANRFVAVEQALRSKSDAEQTRSSIAGLRDQLVVSANEAAVMQQEVANRFVAVEQALGSKADAEQTRNSIATLRDRILAVSGEDDHLFDAFYASLEDRFRGTREDIKERAKVYLPVVKEAMAGSADAPVLDVGCGRGEWLELLKEHQLSARGIDMNRIFVAQCRDLGLDVIEGDGVEYLRTLHPASLGAVTGVHIIEHIAFRNLIALLDEAFRVLRPGGVAIFETPNPENLIVGACNFYVDPTHKRPLPPETMKFFAEARGFADVRIMRLHPFPEAVHVNEDASALQNVVNLALYGPQDYALVAHRP
jgi:SAM-dependent methyltransferase